MTKYLSVAFLTSLLLVRLPPFYIFPLVKSAFLTSHSLSRVVVVGLFAWLILHRDYIRFNRAQVNLIYLFLGYLFIHSISVLGAVNYDAFLLRYKDVVFPGLFLVASLAYMRSKVNFILVMVISLVLNFGYQAIAYLWPSIYSLIGNSLIYEGHREFVAFNLARGRVFIETYDEVVFPFLFVSGFYGLIKNKTARKVLPLLIIFPTLLSNFRSRLLMLVVGVMLTGLAWFKSWKAVIGIMMVGLVVFMSSDAISLRLWGFSMVDRVLLKSNYDDIQSLTSRWQGINHSFELGLSYPVTGIGLGNYFDFLPTYTRNSVFSLSNYYGGVWISSLNPHNIFAQIVAETGLLGLCYYLIMLCIFVRTDWLVYRRQKRNDFAVASVIAFWTLFSYSLFNPTTTLTYNTLFWILRGAIVHESAN